jgi:hypothetical protein
VTVISRRFTASVYLLGINPCVDVPPRVSEAFGKRGYVPVEGTLNGKPIRATLVPMGGGRHRLYLNGDMRRRAQVEVGDEVRIVLQVDARPREVAMRPELAAVLKQNPAARAAFEQLTRSRQKDILNYLNVLKRPESVQRTIDKIIATLTPPEDRKN